MRIEILHIDDCPNSSEAVVRVQAALVELGRDDVVLTRLITPGDDAAGLHFAGSPTILIDGVDAFPTGEQTSDLACRVYRTDSGLAGVPTVAQLVASTRRHLSLHASHPGVQDNR